MTVLVTGANGLVGQELVRAFANDDCVAWTHADLDISDARAVTQRLAAVRPEVVVNAAAWTDVDACERDPDRAEAVNADGPRNLARACAQIDAFLTTISTDYVFGAHDGHGRHPYREDDPTAPVNVYGASKAAGERAVRAEHARHQIVRTSWVYGAARPTFASAILAAARRGDEVTIVGEQWTTPTSARDLAAAMVEIVRSGRVGTFHCTNAGWCSRREYATAIGEAAGVDLLVRAVPDTPDAAAAPRPTWSVLGDAHTRAAGFAPLRPWREALREAVVDGTLDVVAA